MVAQKDQSQVSPETIGKSSGKIPVELSTRFLEHFSEQLYSSPQKAFEELISNGWDAGASCVDVRISQDLSADGATMCVLDNGTSMNAEGLRQLWHIAFSPKRDAPSQFGRPIIGKFGIGKLATYVLASRLTYICKAADGVIRRVTMNFDDIDQEKGAKPDKLIRDIELDLFEVKEKELADALGHVYDGHKILELIRDGMQLPPNPGIDDDFGGKKSEFTKPPQGTWTLVVLSRLKPTGRKLKVGILRRMLEAALPFGTEMAISINEERLTSSKLNAEVSQQWIIGPALGIDSIEVDDLGGANTGEHSESGSYSDNDTPKKTFQITSSMIPVPHIDLPGIGKVTGTIRLFADKLGGGKSEQRGASNGFFVNVLGRVVNQHDPSFGEKNLSHAAWARFRMTVRADGLNTELTTDREKFKEGEKIAIFKAFLRKAFNKARTEYDNDLNARVPDGGDLLVRSLGVLSLNPLRNVVSDTLASKAAVPGLFDESGIDNRNEKRKQWREKTSDNIKAALGEVKFESVKDESFVKFRIADSSIIVNKDHPFVAEHSRTRAEKELLRTLAMINLLSDIYALDAGVDPSIIKEVLEYRDKLLRFRAMQRRQSGTYIAKLLVQTQHDSASHKKLEAVVSDALRYLGFTVEDLAKPGEPEGIARAFSTPTNSSPTDEDPKPPLYSFSFDAKSSKHEAASTGNIKLDGVVEHRERYKADYALVVAPGFEAGALAMRCQQQRVTPIKASDLGKLLEITVKYGAIPLTSLRDLFKYHNWDEVSGWVDTIEGTIKSKRKLTIDIFLKALESYKGKVPDALPAAMIALACRDRLKVHTVKEEDVVALAKGLAILVPDVVGVAGDKIIVNTSAGRLAAAVQSQLERLDSDEPATTDDIIGE